MTEKADKEIRDKLRAMFPDGRLEKGRGTNSWNVTMTHANIQITISGHWISGHGLRVLQMRTNGMDHILPPGKLADLAVKVTQGDGVKVTGSGKSTHHTSLF